MEVIVISIVLAVINYLIAENNGRNKGLAALWGFLFGIFAIIVYLIMGKKKKVEFVENKETSVKNSPEDIKF